MLAPFSLLGHYPANVDFGEKAVVVLLVLVIAWAAWDLGGPLAAAVALLLTFFGTTFIRALDQLILSDALCVAIVVALLPMIRRHSTRLTIAAGFLAGFAVLVRDSGFVVLACLLIALPGIRRWQAAAGAILPVAGLAGYQWATFGRPWLTGYGYWAPLGKLFSVAYVTHPVLWDLHGPTIPNWSFYPQVLGGLEAGWITVAPPLIPLLGWLLAVRSWREPVGRFVLCLPILSLVLFLPYWYQSSRFMAPATFPLIIFFAAAVPSGLTAIRTELTRVPWQWPRRMPRQKTWARLDP